MNTCIDYITQWKNSMSIVTYIPKNTLSFWETEHFVSIINDSNQILSTYKLPETRICFGVFVIQKKDLFVYVHYKYINDIPSVVVGFYNINSDFSFTKKNEFIIPSYHPCGETTGRVYKMLDIFTVGWGDLTNNEYFDIFTFTEESYSTTKQITDIEYDIEHYYFYSDFILVPLATAYNNEYLNLAIFRKGNEDSFMFVLSEIKLPYKHRFDNMEIDNVIIIEFNYYNEIFYCLFRIKLENSDLEVSFDIETYFIDILVNVTNNSLICVSDKYTNQYRAHSSINYENKSIWNKEVSENIFI